ncbi:ribulose-phosphate 3-epimerase [Spirochaetia bacterium]|nr:ribulose-phosphate 3-epimerase [Spirochaetia bacterium]
MAENGADWVHLDVMDGHFVPNITFGPKLVKDLRSCCSLPFDVHLMIDNPELYIADFAGAGADYITFHVEAAVHAHRVVQLIHENGKKAGISIVPSTPVSALECLLPFVDLVLVMTVNPGTGGQSIIMECLEKVSVLKEKRTVKGYNFLISVDGGINEKTAKNAVQAGVDVLVTGSSYFNAADKSLFVQRLR